MRLRLGMGLCVAACAASIVFAADDIKITPDVVYGHKLGMALTFDVYTPPGTANGAGVLFMVSGGWYSEWSPPDKAAPLFKPMLDAGFTVFAVRHGSSPKFGIPEAVEDVRRSVRFIRASAERFGVDPNRLGVCGMSAGGHLSLMLGTASDPGDAKSPDPVLRERPGAGGRGLCRSDRSADHGVERGRAPSRLREIPGAGAERG